MQPWPDNFITYCTNIHGGENWHETFEQLAAHLPKIRTELGEQWLPVGLRLSAIAAQELHQDDTLSKFKDWLNQERCYVVCINGFPYGTFHDAPVKDQVHQPDWTTQDRVQYTEHLAHILAFLLPEGIDEGGISTSPLTYRYWHHEKGLVDRCIDHFAPVFQTLQSIQRDTGKVIHIDIEPEPDGWIEHCTQWIDFYRNDLLPRLIGTGEAAASTVRKHFRLCLDICHFAVGFESIEDVVTQVSAANIPIGRLQISSALKAQTQPNNLNAIQDALRPFDEPTYLHQAVISDAKGNLQSFRDLGPAIDALGLNQEIRTHYHVPIFIEQYGLLSSTQNEVIKALDLFKETPYTRILEVETYTFDILPEDLKTGVTESICREINWVKQQLK